MLHCVQHDNLISHFHILHIPHILLCEYVALDDDGSRGGLGVGAHVYLLADEALLAFAIELHIEGAFGAGGDGLLGPVGGSAAAGGGGIGDEQRRFAGVGKLKVCFTTSSGLMSPKSNCVSAKVITGASGLGASVSLATLGLSMVGLAFELSSAAAAVAFMPCVPASAALSRLQLAASRLSASSTLTFFIR